ncbi:MAG: hypothetical protein V2A73_13340 [Pseudomonadota bacterium]
MPYTVAIVLSGCPLADDSGGRLPGGLSGGITLPHLASATVLGYRYSCSTESDNGPRIGRAKALNPQTPHPSIASPASCQIAGYYPILLEHSPQSRSRLTTTTKGV